MDAEDNELGLPPIVGDDKGTPPDFLPVDDDDAKQDSPRDARSTSTSTTAVEASPVRSSPRRTATSRVSDTGPLSPTRGNRTPSALGEVEITYIHPTMSEDNKFHFTCHEVGCPCPHWSEPFKSNSTQTESRRQHCDQHHPGRKPMRIKPGPSTARLSIGSTVAAAAAAAPPSSETKTSRRRKSAPGSVPFTPQADFLFKDGTPVPLPDVPTTRGPPRITSTTVSTPVANASTVLQTRVDALETQVRTLENAVQTSQNRAVAAEAQVQTLETKVQSLETLVQTLCAKMDVAPPSHMSRLRDWLGTYTEHVAVNNSVQFLDLAPVTSVEFADMVKTLGALLKDDKEEYDELCRKWTLVSITSGDTVTFPTSRITSDLPEPQTLGRDLKLWYAHGNHVNEEHLDEIINIAQVLYGDARHDRTWWKQSLQSSTLAIVSNGERIVSFAAVVLYTTTLDSPVLYLSTIATHAEERGKGYGGTILRSLHAFGRAIQAVCIFTQAVKTHDGGKFWRTKSYEETNIAKILSLQLAMQGNWIAPDCKARVRML